MQTQEPWCLLHIDKGTEPQATVVQELECPKYSSRLVSFQAFLTLIIQWAITEHTYVLGTQAICFHSIATLSCDIPSGQGLSISPSPSYRSLLSKCKVNEEGWRLKRAEELESWTLSVSNRAVPRYSQTWCDQLRQPGVTCLPQ